ncbi:uncharacterized protein LOC119168111 [Rhipicephalus microplus]|uniref:uncharacterized protein LOC119168111 n=1 Tax=Rhipicephalus microplus TaxID=6941 RepID=UPI0018883906|nr:uncharacterized protein LOC119168111 [Rhipicephalus microplus]
MRSAVCLLLSCFVALAMGGGLQPKKKRELPGYEKPYHVNRNDSSPCASHGLTTSCGGKNGGWHYYSPYGLCTKNDNSHCALHSKPFPSCEACMKQCKIGVCVQETTPPTPPPLPKVNPFGR